MQLEYANSSNMQIPYCPRQGGVGGKARKKQSLPFSFSVSRLGLARAKLKGVCRIDHSTWLSLLAAKAAPAHQLEAVCLAIHQSSD